jgi:hypothetical protein
MKNVSIEHLENIIESYVNGNISLSVQAIKKLNREDRARIVSQFRCNVDTKTAFKIAERIITNDF